jgi:hypothetical protein
MNNLLLSLFIASKGGKLVVLPLNSALYGCFMFGKPL